MNFNTIWRNDFCRKFLKLYLICVFFNFINILNLKILFCLKIIEGDGPNKTILGKASLIKFFKFNP